MTEEFDNFDLKDNLLKGIFSYGFEKPSEIQNLAIPQIISRHDLIAQAQSGTGKTGTFTIGLLQILDETLSETQGLILAPTRELAEQINEVISSLSIFLNVQLHLSVGGTSVQAEREKLTEKIPHVVVGTPGRILQMIEEKYLSTNHIKILIMDEADEILKIGFREQIMKIFSYIPKNSQIAIFSATMPKEALDISKHFLVNPVNILVKADEVSLKGIRQFYIFHNHENYKLETLIDLYSRLCVSQAIIFVNSKKKVNILYENLKAHGFSIGVMHSEMTMKDRNEVYMKFRKGLYRVVVATDVLARGIDIQGISFVINYDIPRNKEVYIHRIGRSGRYGRKGVAINFVTNEDFRDLKTIEKFYSTTIEEMPEDISMHL